MRRRIPIATLAIAVLVAACGSSASAPSAAPGPSGVPGSSAAARASVVPVIVSSQQFVGDNRFVFSLLDATSNQPVAAPDRTASVAFIAPGETNPGTATPGEFVWAITGSRGEYISHVTFSSAGDWKAIFLTQAKGGSQEAIGVGFQVQAQGTVIAVGQAAPASKTPTSADVGGNLAMIATDPKPDPRFYQLSISEAIARHTPFVVIFATPAFCVSGQCGPTLDHVKAIAATAPSSVAFVNVEPYILKFTEGRLQPVLDANNQLQPVQAVSDWGLLSEPWIFTVDRAGVVRGSFEGVVSDAELNAAIAQIAGS